MFGPFKSTGTLLGGLLWKIPWRMSSHQKQRVRHRLRDVDEVVKQINLGLHIERCEEKGMDYSQALSTQKMFKPRVKALRLLNKPSIFPRESHMSPRDKYTVFDKKSPGYRKGIHKVPKWTKLSLRNNPRYF
ncbi:MRPL31 (YKL138C) [Zygosaccharomyces parabailii]|nr:MRPL31 (YKL138C) [Zygosaccharomyces parabailii]CDH10211.1 probable 54S ribosomal protein L31,mitochondrial [Zygosaccharomyces bailii ISA1307]